MSEDLGLSRNVIESGSAVTTNISGNNVVITSANVLARTSGQPGFGGTNGFTAPELKITSNSGGVQLLSGAVIGGVAIVPPSTNSGNLYLGFTATRPYSGFGIRIEPGAPATIPVNNPNVLYLFAQVSGDVVSYGGVQ